MIIIFLIDYNNNQWKLQIKPESNNIIMNIQNLNEFHIYESFFISKFHFISNLFQLNDSIHKMINFILSTLEKKEFILDENLNGCQLILLSTQIKPYQMSFFLPKIETEKINNKEKEEDDFFDFEDEFENYFQQPIISLSISNIEIIKSHNDKITSISIFPSGNFISVSYDKSIIIYDLNFNIIQIIENAHEQWIYNVSIKDENNFITCSTDESIKIWIKRNNYYYLKYTINESHNGWINKIIYCSNGNIISCSEDKSIKIWEEIYNNEYQLICKLIHSDFVYSILLLEDKNLLISSGYEGTKFWNTNNYQCINYIDDAKCYNSNSICRIDDDKIIIGSEWDCKMKVISILRKKIIKEIDNEFCCFGICEIESKGVFLTCGDNKNIRIYKNEDCECIKIINNAHDEQINGICKLNDYLFLSYSDDNYIKIWTI